MTAQLRLWERDETRLDAESPVLLSVRESRKARQLIIQALPPRTVEVVVPRGMRADFVRGFITEHRDWITRAGAELIASYPSVDLRPDLIDLSALEARVAVRYTRVAETRRSRYRFDGSELVLLSATEDSASYLGLLRRWLLEQAKATLKPWLGRVGAQIGLQPSSVQVRLQKTRWGSCSSKGSISLNAALLLVPPDLVRYLFVHELSHLRHMSHSRRYWQSVARFAPNYRELDRRLAAHWRTLPGWLFALTHGVDR
jgi:predicted metal-dependent hydrolase